MEDALLKNKSIREYLKAFPSAEQQRKIAKYTLLYGLQSLKNSFGPNPLTPAQLEQILLRNEAVATLKQSIPVLNKELHNVSSKLEQYRRDMTGFGANIPEIDQMAKNIFTPRSAISSIPASPSSSASAVSSQPAPVKPPKLVLLPSEQREDIQPHLDERQELHERRSNIENNIPPRRPIINSIAKNHLNMINMQHTRGKSKSKVIARAKVVDPKTGFVLYSKPSADWRQGSSSNSSSPSRSKSPHRRGNALRDLSNTFPFADDEASMQQVLTDPEYSNYASAEPIHVQNQIYPSWWGYQETPPSCQSITTPPHKRRPNPRLAYSVQQQPDQKANQNFIQDDLVTTKYLNAPSSGYTKPSASASAPSAAPVVPPVDLTEAILLMGDPDDLHKHIPDHESSQNYSSISAAAAPPHAVSSAAPASASSAPLKTARSNASASSGSSSAPKTARIQEKPPAAAAPAQQKPQQQQPQQAKKQKKAWEPVEVKVMHFDERRDRRMPSHQQQQHELEEHGKFPDRFSGPPMWMRDRRGGVGWSVDKKQQHNTVPKELQGVQSKIKTQLIADKRYHEQMQRIHSHFTSALINKEDDDADEELLFGQGLEAEQTRENNGLEQVLDSFLRGRIAEHFVPQKIHSSVPPPDVPPPQQRATGIHHPSLEDPNRSDAFRLSRHSAAAPSSSSSRPSTAPVSSVSSPVFQPSNLSYISQPQPQPKQDNLPAPLRNSSSAPRPPSAVPSSQPRNFLSSLASAAPSSSSHVTSSHISSQKSAHQSFSASSPASNSSSSYSAPAVSSVPSASKQQSQQQQPQQQASDVDASGPLIAPRGEKPREYLQALAGNRPQHQQQPQPQQQPINSARSNSSSVYSSQYSSSYPASSRSRGGEQEPEEDDDYYSASSLDMFRMERKLMKRFPPAARDAAAIAADRVLRRSLGKNEDDVESLLALDEAGDSDTTYFEDDLDYRSNMGSDLDGLTVTTAELEDRHDDFSSAYSSVSSKRSSSRGRSHKGRGSSSRSRQQQQSSRSASMTPSERLSDLLSLDADECLNSDDSLLMAAAGISASGESKRSSKSSNGSRSGNSFDYKAEFEPALPSNGGRQNRR